MWLWRGRFACSSRRDHRDAVKERRVKVWGDRRDSRAGGEECVGRTAWEEGQEWRRDRGCLDALAAGTTGAVECTWSLLVRTSVKQENKRSALTQTEQT